MKDKIVPVALALTALALLAALSAPRTHFEQPVEAQPAPDFNFALAGQPTSLSAQQGRVIVMNFWASWCAPCVTEMPSLQRLHEKMADRGVLVLGINLDDNERLFREFMRDYYLSFPNYFDQPKHIAALYGTFKYPETYIIDRDGILARKIIGPLEWDDPVVITYLESLL